MRPMLKPLPLAMTIKIRAPMASSHFITVLSLVLPKERVAELRAGALAYQAALTKTGTVRKRAANPMEVN